MTGSSAPFRPREILARLNATGVRFIVIGGIAAQYQGSDVFTIDLDVCYARDPENLERLAGVLGDVHATIRGAPPDLPFRLDAKTLRKGDAFNFDTDFGAFDVLGSPSGGFDFEKLSVDAVDFQVDEEIRVRLASIDDLIAMKRAAGRTKDRLWLEHLGALREELDRRR